MKLDIILQENKEMVELVKEVSQEYTIKRNIKYRVDGSCSLVNYPN